jgi:hypothetical protein
MFPTLREINVDIVTGGGVKATLLTRGVELGNRLEIDCRAEPGCPSFNLRDGYPMVQSLNSTTIASHQVNSLNYI